MTRRLAILLLGVLGLAGCDALSPFRSGDDVPALIIFYGDTSRILAPDTVSRGVPFDVTFRSYGGGCYTGPAGDAVTYSSSLATITAYDHVTGGDYCTAVLKFLQHTVTLKLDAAGPATIYLYGEQRGASTGSKNGPATLTRQVIVR